MLESGTTRSAGVGATSARPPGLRTVLNEELLSRASIREYSTAATIEGETYDLVIRYSDFHPYLRLEVLATHRFTTHQHPFAGNLCLLRGGTWGWDVSETAGRFVRSQLGRVVSDLRELRADRHSAVDDHVEPFVGYYDYLPDTAIRVDGSWADIDECDAGLMMLGVERPANAECLRGVVLDIADETGRSIRRADDALFLLFPERVRARWRRLPARPSDDGADGVIAAVEAAGPLPPLGGQRRVGKVDVDVIGAVFSDGVSPGVQGDAWIFLVRGVGPKKPSGRVTSAPIVGPYLARSYRVGRDDMSKRVPALSPLASKKVVAVGAGGVGAPTIIELAKAGVGKLLLFEGDTVDPATAPRWPLGFGAAGHAKLIALRNLILWNWPYVSLDLRPVMLGATRDGPAVPPHWELLNEALAEADLLLDLTAEVGLGYLLSEVAKEFGIPCIAASTTEGGWGGRVVRFTPGRDTMCWTCLMNHEEDNPGLIPPSDPDPATASVWPRGCVDPTFTGTGFDVGAIAMAAARLAAATLCGGDSGAYPPADWDLAVYTFRDAARTWGPAPEVLQRLNLVSEHLRKPVPPWLEHGQPTGLSLSGFGGFGGRGGCGGLSGGGPGGFTGRSGSASGFGISASSPLVAAPSGDGKQHGCYSPYAEGVTTTPRRYRITGGCAGRPRSSDGHRAPSGPCRRCQRGPQGGGLPWIAYGTCGSVNPTVDREFEG